MSNNSLKAWILDAVIKFEKKEIGLTILRDILVNNGKALEAMPYSMIKELDRFDYKLTVFQYHLEENSIINTDKTIVEIKAWLLRIPA